VGKLRKKSERKKKSNKNTTKTGNRRERKIKPEMQRKMKT
jgi:hypothetical protein